MKKRPLSLFKLVLRFLIVLVPYSITIVRMLIDGLDNIIQRLVIRLLDKWNLHDYERLQETEKFEML